MKKLSVLFLFVFCASMSFAQFQSTNKTFGAVIGFGGVGFTGEGALPIGVEYMFYKWDDKLNIGAYGGFASTSTEFISGTATYTNILVAATGNYHFSPGEKFDPFAGVSLGYIIASSSWESKAGFGNTDLSVSAGGLLYSGHAGFNYWMSNSWAVQVRVGLLPYVGAGVLFNM